MITLILAGVALIVLILGGLWISFSIGIAGIISLMPFFSLETILSLIGRTAYNLPTNFLLIAIPFFMLLGDVLSSGGLTDELYKGCVGLFQRLPGGLLQVTTVISTIFGAVTGSGLACCAVVARMTYPELCIKRKYDPTVATGLIAGSGVLGPLIPPSIFMIIYGSIVNERVDKLLISGTLPGIMLAAMFMGYIAIWAKVRPEIAPREAVMVPLGQSVKDLARILPIMFLLVAVMGVMFLGWATPTEAAVGGVVMALILVAAYRRFHPKLIWQGVLDTVSVSAMILLILIAANVFVFALAQYNIPIIMAEFAKTIGSPLMLFTLFAVIYFILGCFFDGLSMSIITLPFVIPALEAVGLSAFWFGSPLILLIGIGAVTPPVGLHLFVVQGVTGVPLDKIVKGSIPYIILQIVALYILFFLPQIVTWLPDLME